MGFSFHITTIYQGAELPLHYKNHLETVYCISGEGSIENCASGEVHEIQPGVLYALDKHDRHILRGRTEMRSEEHTSEQHSLMRISYAVVCLKKKTKQTTHHSP